MRIRNTEDYKKYLALLTAGCPIPGGDHAVEDQEYQELEKKRKNDDAS